MLDPVMNSEIMAASEDGSGIAEGGKSFPNFPSEAPTKSELIKWLDSWKDDLTAAGFNALLRGELTYELKKLSPRNLLTVPVGATDAKKAALEAKNADIEFNNEQSALELDARLIEMKTRLSGKIQKALRPKAPLKLGKLEKAHPLKNQAGTVVVDSDGVPLSDGVAMYLALSSERTKEADDYAQTLCEKRYEKLRDSPLPANCSPDTFSTRVNFFLVQVNPYLDRKLTGASLGKFIIKQLPESMGSDKRMLERELEKDGKLDDAAEVQQRCLKTVQSAYKPSSSTPKPAEVMAGVVAGGDGGGAGGNLSQKSVKKLIAAALKDASKSGGGDKGNGDKGGGDKGGGDRNRTGKAGLRSGNRLPDGQKCKEGYCDFAHDQLKPGEPCYRAPGFEGPIPLATWENVQRRERINVDKQANAKKFNLPYKPLKAPPGAKADGMLAVGGTGDPLLSELFGLGAVVDVEGGGLALGEDSLGMDDDESGYGFADEVWTLDTRSKEEDTGKKIPEMTPVKAPNSRLNSECVEEPSSDSSADGWHAQDGCKKACCTNPFETPTRPSSYSVPAGKEAGAQQSKLAATTPLGDSHVDVSENMADNLSNARLVDKSPMLGPQSFSMGEHAARLAMAAALLIGLGMSIAACAYGTNGTYLMLLQIYSYACGSPGLTTTFAALGFCSDVAPSYLPAPNAMSAIWVFAGLYLLVVLAESWVTGVLVSAVWRLIRGTLSIVDPQAIRRRGGHVVGVGSVLLCVLCLLNGVGGVDSRAQGAYAVARAGADLVTGPAGDHLRFALDDFGASRLNVVRMPVMLNATDTVRVVQALRLGGEPLDVGDTGAAIHVEQDERRAIEGSVRANTMVVHTANGPVVPPTKCDVRRQIPCSDGTVEHVIVRDALIMPDCAHNLTSLGRLARDEHIGFILGAGDAATYLSFKNGKRAPLLNLGVVVMPSVKGLASVKGMASANAATARGSRSYANVPGELMHARGNHSETRILRNWHRCTSDVTEKSCRNVKEQPCDSCLEGVAPAVASNRTAPVVTEPGDLVAYDVFSLGVKHVHGGQTKVFGMHDFKSGLNFVKLLKDETAPEIASALREAHAYYQSKKVVIRHVHTDNAKPHLSKLVISVVRDEMKARYTTIAPNTPRSNGTMERQWRTMAGDAIRMLHKSKLPRNYAWYALQQSVAVRNTLPFESDPDNCPLSVFTGEKPSAAHFRVFGCVCYAKVFDRITKMSNQAVRCVHLGRAPNQSGYLCYEPSTRTMHVSVHVAFVETSFPGLTLAKEGWDEVIPEFHDEFDASAPRADEGEMEAVDRGSLTDGVELSPLLPDAPDIGEEAQDPVFQPEDDGGDAVDDGNAAAARGAVPPPAARARAPRAARAPQPQLAASHRPRRNHSNYSADQRARGSVLSASSALISVMAAFKPGGWGVGTQVLGLEDHHRGAFVIYLCSGVAHEGDFTRWVKELSTTETYVVNVDIERGGYSHDLASPAVAARLKELALKPECIGVLATIPCSTWSPARFSQPGPKPLRNLTHPEGIPGDDGELPANVRIANAIAKHCIEIAEAVASHGGSFIFENPVGRDKNSPFAISGREDHASLWRLPAMVTFAKRHGEHVIHFDQCRTGSATQKTTQLLCSANILEQVRTRLGTLACNHPPGTHGSIIAGAEGEFKTKATEQFTSDLNRHLAQCFLSPPAIATPDSWLGVVGRAIEPFTNMHLLGLSGMVTALTADATVAKAPDDPIAIYRAMESMYAELDDDGQQRAAMIMAEAEEMVRPIIIDRSTAFAVSQANRNSDDNPGYKRAMSGPERQNWRDACDDEIGNFEEHGTFEPVAEDTCPTWNASTRRAPEVVDMMWVLKKKYDELGNLLKYKARGTIRGDMETKADAANGLPPAATFAPTIRHNTLKCLIAASVALAAKRESSGAQTHPLRMRSLDVAAAFLNGAASDERVRFVRPPDGYRGYDRRGVPIVWRCDGNCYGRTVAPRVWYETLDPFLQDSRAGLGMNQSEVDPCYYYKIYADGTRLDMGVHVDDSWICDNAGAKADADLAKLSSRFKIKLEEKPSLFLNMNVTVESPTRVKISSENYIIQMADKYLPDWRQRPKVQLPSTTKIRDAYERCLLREHTTSPELLQRFRGKTGAMLYASPSVRVDACCTIARFSRALTFPTEEFDAMADDCVTYLAQTASDGITYDGHAANAETLLAECDSDWCVGHSTTGWACYLAGAAVAHSSKRQACIAMSSTEAEIIAASACALEIQHLRVLLREMGLEQVAPTQLNVDNSGAVELSRDRKSCHRSRHVDRRYFKVRELSAQGLVRVEHVDTKENSADILTKPLDSETYHKHRSRLMNQPRVESKLAPCFWMETAAISATVQGYTQTNDARLSNQSREPG